MACSLEEILLQDTRCLFEEFDRVLLAVSGGADSVAMTHALYRLHQQGGLNCDFMIGHINHCLRGPESNADEAFVEQLGRSLGLPVVSQRVDINKYAKEHKLSIETAGRVVRLQALARMAEENDCDVIATAHHKDDLAETMIHRLMRGTGFRGLCGIRPISCVYGAKFIRPMLEFRREEIVQYCRDNSIQWREDASNRNINFTRNKIRHHLLPTLNNDNVVEQLAVLSRKGQRFLLWTEKQAQSILAKGQFDRTGNRFCIDRELLQNCSPWILHETVRQVLVQLGVGQRDYTQDHFMAIREMVEQQSSKADFPGQLEITVENSTASFQIKTRSPMPLLKPILLGTGQTVQFGPWEITSRLLDASEVDVKRFFKTKDAFVEWFDADTISGSLIICRRQDGDRFWPIGASGEKKVGRFLIDAQLDHAAKQRALIIKDAERILWLAPIRMSENAKLTSKSREIIEIKVQQITP